ncbi:TetR family transcriptional regulator [Actinocorallia herbida]|uniref:TetR family transcriptional regulator n=1 Tax=Actinocorallia herbida TaxID=58109 RepID=A0A3N1CZ58_9ACTN|nr:TetR/AcrR family transcriptional regulator [Actinocorallia herbida]ROO86549.1 TetR family transcriptional regulator [Actinocorallia herbida]
MARNATETRARLVQAGARLFAEQGVAAAKTRDIVWLAGQANDSAITYHFGSREGLLEAILRAGMDRMEPVRASADLAGADVRGVVAAIVEPIAAELETEEGRDFLRVVAQVSGQAGVRTREAPPFLAGTEIARQLSVLEKSLAARLPEPVALERVAALIAFLTAALADRAARPEPHLLPHAAFTADLTAMLSAALQAPPPPL